MASDLYSVFGKDGITDFLLANKDLERSTIYDLLKNIGSYGISPAMIQLMRENIDNLPEIEVMLSQSRTGTPACPGRAGVPDLLGAAWHQL